MGTAKGAEGASIPPEWVREAGWRQDVKELLAKTEGLNSSQKKCVTLCALLCCGVLGWALFWAAIVVARLSQVDTLRALPHTSC